MGLENNETMEEIVMVAYKNAISDALFMIVRNANANHVDLAWLPKKIIEHIQQLIDNTDLLLSPLSDSEEATLDGKPFPTSTQWILSTTGSPLILTAFTSSKNCLSIFLSLPYLPGDVSPANTTRMPT
jgi:hypothetical protein